MSAQERWQFSDHIKDVAKENHAVVVAWLAGYVLALEDVEADVKGAIANGSTSIEDALEEIQVTMAAVKRAQSTIEGWN